MKLRNLIPTLGLAALLVVGCAQVSGDAGNNVTAEEAAAECAEASDCCAVKAETECSEAKQEACEAKCPDGEPTGDVN